jgi:two-component sensor histidine kinase/sensor domain CHASE-containing protein
MERYTLRGHMRRRILLAIGGTLLVMLVIISLASSALLRDSYAALERRYIERDARRVAGAVSREAAGLGRTVEDYSAWTDMYRFVQHPSSEFAKTTFTEDSAENVRINFVIAENSEGRIVYRQAFGTPAPGGAMLDDLTRWVEQHPDLVRITDRNGTAEGVVSLSTGLVILAARPVLDDLRSLPAGGTLIMGRVFDNEAVSQVGTQLVVRVKVYPLNGAPLPEAVRRAQEKVTAAAPLYMDTTQAAMASMYTALEGLDGAAAALIEVDLPRDIREQGTRTVRYFYIWLFIVGAGFCGVVLLTIERTVLSRLVRLGTSMLAIGTGGDPTRRIAISGKDQIAYIGAAINGMLDAQAKATEQLRASERRNEAFLDAIPDAIFRVTRDGTILDARSPRQLPLLEAANDLVGRDAEMIVSLYSFLSPELFDKSIAATAAALDTGTPQMLAFHIDSESGRRWFEERFVPGSETEAIVLVREVTDLKQAEEARRKEILLKEIHHRVKNNLQVISSLLALQASATNDAVTRGLLNESRNRVHSMALIHEKLYHSTDERGVRFNGYVADLAAHLRNSYAGNSDAVTISINVQEITLDMDVLVPCGLIINELMTNALKYAFPGGRAGTITIAMRREPAEGGATLVLTVSDDGVGLPATVDMGAPHSLGLRIVNSLVGQLRATLAVGPGPGTSFTITFPEV